MIDDQDLEGLGKDRILLNPNAANPLEDALSMRKPDFSKKFANIHYASEVTDEIGCIVIRDNTTMEDVMRQYCSQFPKEARIFMDDIALEKQKLFNSNGMSANKTMLSLGSIPEIIVTAAKFIYGEHYWEDKRNTLDFFRQNPKLRIGHTKGPSGTIIH